MVIPTERRAPTHDLSKHVDCTRMVSSRRELAVLAARSRHQRDRAVVPAHDRARGVDGAGEVVGRRQIDERTGGRGRLRRARQAAVGSDGAVAPALDGPVRPDAAHVSMASGDSPEGLARHRFEQPQSGTKVGRRRPALQSSCVVDRTRRHARCQVGEAPGRGRGTRCAPAHHLMRGTERAAAGIRGREHGERARGWGCARRGRLPPALDLARSLERTRARVPRRSLSIRPGPVLSSVFDSMIAATDAASEDEKAGAQGRCGPCERAQAGTTSRILRATCSPYLRHSRRLSPRGTNFMSSGSPTSSILSSLRAEATCSPTAGLQP